MFKMFDEVIIVSAGVSGTIVDIDEKGNYTIEGMEQINGSGRPYSGEYPIYLCREDDLAKPKEKRRKLKQAVAVL